MESTKGSLIFDAAKSNIIATLSPECAPRTRAQYRDPCDKGTDTTQAYCYRSNVVENGFPNEVVSHPIRCGLQGGLWQCFVGGLRGDGARHAIPVRGQSGKRFYELQIQI